MKNFRELGYSNIKKGLLFRSEQLFNLSNEERNFLKEVHHIKTVVDLRTLEECQAEKDPSIPGINNINISILTPNKEQDSAKKEQKVVIINGITLPDISDYYRQIVNKDKKDSWTRIFDLLLKNDGGILFHCSAGKDRTGVVVAIILTALGIDKETIYKDYLLTNVDPIIPTPYLKFAETLDKETGEKFLDHFSAKKEYLDAAFDEINKQFGSIDAFLKQCCNLADDKLVLLKKKYLMMNIKTKRLSIKELSPNDQKGMIELLNNTEIKRTYMIPDFDSEEQLVAYFNKLLNISIEGKTILLGVYLNDYIIGMTNQVSESGEEIELGYFIDPIYWNKGYATEVLSAMIEKMFSLGYKRVITGFFKGNIASEKVMAKCNMHKIDKVDTIFYKNKSYQCLYYEIDNK